MKHDKSFIFPHETSEMEAILFKICVAFGVMPKSILETKRGSLYEVYIRQLAMFAIRLQLGSSYPVIGTFFNRDHSTVLYAVDKVGGDDEMMSKYATIFSGDNMGITLYKEFKTYEEIIANGPVGEIYCAKVDNGVKSVDKVEAYISH